MLSSLQRLHTLRHHHGFLPVINQERRLLPDSWRPWRRRELPHRAVHSRAGAEAQGGPRPCQAVEQRPRHHLRGRRGRLVLRRRRQRRHVCGGDSRAGCVPHGRGGPRAVRHAVPDRRRGRRRRQVVPGAGAGAGARRHGRLEGGHLRGTGGETEAGRRRRRRPPAGAAAVRRGAAAGQGAVPDDEVEAGAPVGGHGRVHVRRLLVHDRFQVRRQGGGDRRGRGHRDHLHRQGPRRRGLRRHP
ncbi:Os11g0270201 [Oryza sativa Japonica Group]|uniref:Os11g0270201 protein n=1 Tax=Oryza sativa subsp. japonica TaxID=39947 RepID=A0A0P0Y103_ORYSJ|nr:hypothetical protein EE612_054692 [Oryza sativa]BAT13556.1 Os11g0270201 [Oryza sativa Japonica Group]